MKNMPKAFPFSRGQIDRFPEEFLLKVLFGEIGFVNKSPVSISYRIGAVFKVLSPVFSKKIIIGFALISPMPLYGFSFP